MRNHLSNLLGKRKKKKSAATQIVPAPTGHVPAKPAAVDPAPTNPAPTTIVFETDSTPKYDVQPNDPQPELHSERLNLKLAEDPNYQRKLDAIDYSIEVLDLFKKLSEVIKLVIPDALGAALQTITAILERLKKMIENKQAWKDLLISIDDRQRAFNEQLGGVKEHEIPPPLLTAMKRYAQSLEKLAAGVMEQANISLKSPSIDERVLRIKAFVARAYNADSDAEDINAYKGELDAVVSEFETALAMYTAMTVNRITRKADNLKALMFLEGSNAAERSPFGTKHTECLKNTRFDILEDIRRWEQTDDPEAKLVYCIGDMAGTGKSTIAYTMAKEWGPKKCISFFFSNTSGDRAQTLCISLAKQIIGSCHGDAWDEYWAELASELSSPASQDAKNLWEKLVSQPLAKCTDHKGHILLVDALDECESRTRIPLFKCLLKTCASGTQSRLRLLLTTRKDDDIESIFAQETYRERILQKSLLTSSQTEGDITKYLEHRMSKWKGKGFDPTKEQKNHLVKRCSGLFMFASLACGLLEDELPMNRSRRLQDILGEFTSLDRLYRQTLSLAEGSSVYTREPLRKILGAILVAQKPLSITSIAALLSHPMENVRQLVKKLGSILGSGDDSDPVYILHATLKEFLLRENLVETNKNPHTGRVRQEKIENEYYILEPEAHLAMLNGCLSIMAKQLTFNICHLETSCLLNDQWEDMESRIQRYISDGLHYSCLQWASHLELAAFDAEIIKHLQNFMENSFLFWLEVLSVTKCVGSASGMLKTLTEWMKTHDKDDIMAAEMGKFVTTFTSVIVQSAPHIYLSALPFTPSNSPVSKCYLKRYSRTMKVPRGRFGHWPIAQNVLSGHEHSVESIVFSPNGRHIVSSSHDNTIRVWDAETGEAVGVPFKLPLKGPYNSFNSIALSPDGKRVAYSCYDGKISVYDIETGEAVGVSFEVPLGGHYRSGISVIPVAFSPDSKRVVHGSGYNTIRVWDTETCEAVGAPFRGHGSSVNSVAFSPDGKRVVSGSDDKTIRVSDVETGEAVGAPFKGHDDAVVSVVFSPDSKRIVSGSDDKTIRVWDAKTGEALGSPFRGHDSRVTSVAFSPDSKRVVSGSWDKTVRVWDTETGEAVVAPFRGDNGEVNSVAFSPDGKRVVSGCDDDTIRIWDAEIGDMVGAPFKFHNDVISSVAFSPDGKRIVSGSEDNTIRLWDADTGEAVGEPFRGHNNGVTSVMFSPDSKRVVSGSRDRTIRVWDTETGEAVGAPFNGHDDVVYSVAFSPDGKKVVSGSENNTIRLWDAETGEAVGAQFRGHNNRVTSVMFSPDSNRVVSGSCDRTVRVRDTETGEAVGALFKGHDDEVGSVTFSPDGKRPVSSSSDDTFSTWGTETGDTAGAPFGGYDNSIYSVAFSPDGKRIASGSECKTIQVWDAETGEAVGVPFTGHDGAVHSVAFSPDSKGIVSSSEDGTTRVWDAETGQAVGVPLKGARRSVRSAVFSPDGKRIISFLSGGIVQVWDVETGLVVGMPFEDHELPLYCAALSPDGNRLASGSEDHAIRVWDIYGIQLPSFTFGSWINSGWMVNSDDDLIFWVPPQLRAGFPSNGAVFVIGPVQTTFPDFTAFVYGEDWALCKG